jgi:hypothetical protein
MEIVEGMLRAGAAKIVMGNHEFNALGYHTTDGKGGYLRPHTEKNFAQHAETLRYFKKNPGAKDRAIAWFYSFPLWLDLGFARIVQAAWSLDAIRLLKTPYLTPETLDRASEEENPEYRAVETLLKGVQVNLSDKVAFRDKDEHPRHEIRLRWWLKPDSERTVAETVFPPDPTLPDTRFTTPSDWEPYEPTEPPSFSVITGYRKTGRRRTSCRMSFVSIIARGRVDLWWLIASIRQERGKGSLPAFNHRSVLEVNLSSC